MEQAIHFKNTKYTPNLAIAKLIYLYLIKDQNTVNMTTTPITFHHSKKGNSNGTIGPLRKAGQIPHSTARNQDQRKFSSSLCSNGFQPKFWNRLIFFPSLVGGHSPPFTGAIWMTFGEHCHPTKTASPETLKHQNIPLCLCPFEILPVCGDKRSFCADGCCVVGGVVKGNVAIPDYLKDELHKWPA